MRSKGKSDVSHPAYKPGDRFVVEVERVLPPGGGEVTYRLSNGAAWPESRLKMLDQLNGLAVHSRKPKTDPVGFLCRDLEGESNEAVLEAVSEFLSRDVSDDTAARHAMAWMLSELEG